VDMFLPFVIKVFGSLHQETDNFLHQCDNMAWIAKGTRGPPLSMLCSFYSQRVFDDITKSTSCLHLEMGCYCRGGFIWAWSFIGFTSPLFSYHASCKWWKVWFYNDSLSSLWPASFGLLACLDIRVLHWAWQLYPYPTHYAPMAPVPTHYPPMAPCPYPLPTQLIPISPSPK
jgi:hypothetical protein